MDQIWAFSAEGVFLVREIFLTDDQKAKVEANMNLARYFCKKYLPPNGVDHEDWFQEIVCSLCYAVAWHDDSKGTLASLLGSILRNRWKDLRNYNRKYEGVKSIYLECGEEGAVIADLLQTSDSYHGDAVEEINSIIPVFPEEWQVACRNAINPSVCSKADADTVNEIRSGFRLRGRASYCFHCSTVFIGAENGMTKYCKECRKINNRFLGNGQKQRRRDRIASSRSQAS